MTSSIILEELVFRIITTFYYILLTWLCIDSCRKSTVAFLSLFPGPQRALQVALSSHTALRTAADSAGAESPFGDVSASEVALYFPFPASQRGPGSLALGPV